MSDCSCGGKRGCKFEDIKGTAVEDAVLNIPRNHGTFLGSHEKVLDARIERMTQQFRLRWTAARYKESAPSSMAVPWMPPRPTNPENKISDPFENWSFCQ